MYFYNTVVVILYNIAGGNNSTEHANTSYLSVGNLLVNKCGNNHGDDKKLSTVAFGDMSMTGNQELANLHIQGNPECGEWFECCIYLYCVIFLILTY